jgi:hypothetical protein
MLGSAPSWRAAIVVALAVATWIAGCENGPPVTGPEETELPLVLSDTAAERADSLSSASTSSETSGPSLASATAAATNVIFVSLSPGAVPNGVAVTIRKQNGGNPVTVPVVDGGFDPIAVEAGAGDVLVFEIQLTGTSSPLTLLRTVPARRPPRVVRTNPPPKKRDVALNASIFIVFSEPIDASTLGDASVQLLRSGTRVAGRVELRDAKSLTFAFVPAGPLSAATDYELLVTQGVRDQDGEPLETSATVPFTTRNAAGVPNASVVLVPEDVATIQEAVDAVRGGGVVRVRPGVYAEAIAINKALTIEGSTETGEVRIVPPTGTASAITITTAEPVTLRGLTIDHLGLEVGTYEDYGRIGIHGTGPANVTIMESTVLRANFGALIENDAEVIGQRGDLVVRNSTFDGGEPSRMEVAVFATSHVDALIERNTVRRTLWSCIQVQDHANGEVVENDVDMCGLSGGIRVWLYGSTAANVIGNTVRNSQRSNSRFGIFFGWGTGVIERNSVIDYVQPTADASFGAAAIRLREAAVAVRFNDISGNSHAGLRSTASVAVNAACNWWGATDGPSGIGGGSGDAVLGAATFVPFATVPIAGTPETACSGQPPPATQLAFTVQPATTVAGRPIAPAVRVTARDALGNISPLFAGTVTVRLGANPGGSTLGGSITATALNGVATFHDLRVDRAGSGYVLTASTDGLASATSAPFDVVPPTADVMYFQNFETAPGPEWSSTRRNTVPNDRYPSPSFLGEFGCIDYDDQESRQAEKCREADAVTLALSSLPQHDEVTISFDLYLIRTWDGNAGVSSWDGSFAPDVFNLSVVGGPTLLNATFANHPERPHQSYPAQYPTDGSAAPNNPHHTGALAIDALGYDMDAVYRLTFTFAHAEPTVTFKFTAPDLQQLWDESWGLDNVEVKARLRNP